MRTLRGLLLVWRYAFSSTLRGKRLAVLLLLAALPVFAAWMLTAFHDGVRVNDFAQLMYVLVFHGVSPLAGLFLGVAVLGDEIEGRTITYLFTRPLARPTVFAGRLLGCAAGFALILFAAVAAAGALFARRFDLSVAEVVGTATIAAAGFGVYAAVFAALRAFFRRALFIGFFLGFIFEGMVSKLPATNLSQCSVWHHVVLIETRLLEGQAIRPPPGLTAGETVAGSVQVLVAIFLVAVALGAWRVHTKEIRIPTAVA